MGGLELGTGELAVLVAIGIGKPLRQTLLPACLAVGLVDVAVVIGIVLGEAGGKRAVGGGLGTADAAIIVAVKAVRQALPALTVEAPTVPGMTTPGAATFATAGRSLPGSEAAILVGIECIKTGGKAGVGSGLAAVDDAIAIGIGTGALAGFFRCRGGCRGRGAGLLRQRKAGDKQQRAGGGKGKVADVHGCTPWCVKGAAKNAGNRQGLTPGRHDSAHSRFAPGSGGQTLGARGRCRYAGAMSDPMPAPVRFYTTGEHACGYWPQRQARNLLLEPGHPQWLALYPQLLAQGFRRTGQMLYRPHCTACRDCLPVRVPVTRFVPSRSQRRNLKANADLHVQVMAAARTGENFALYREYQRQRHPDGDMAQHTEADFERFLCPPGSATCFMEIRLPRAGGSQLLAVAVTDVLPDALSAVYTFHHPAFAARGLGVFAILQQLQWAARAGLPYLYLGFWLAGHRKMDYKRHYRPLEGYDGRHWFELDAPR